MHPFGDWRETHSVVASKVLGGSLRRKRNLPTVDTTTVILLFTDIQGSTSRWERDRSAMGAAVRRHDELMSAAIAASRGRVFKTVAINSAHLLHRLGLNRSSSPGTAGFGGRGLERR